LFSYDRIKTVGKILLAVYLFLVKNSSKSLGVRAEVGIFEAPIIPTNIRCVAAWFPDRERALVVGVYTG